MTIHSAKRSQLKKDVEARFEFSRKDGLGKSKLLKSALLPVRKPITASFSPCLPRHHGKEPGLAPKRRIED
jgi:hypothetical protein